MTVAQHVCEVCGGVATHARYQDLCWNPNRFLTAYDTVRVLCDKHDQPGLSAEDDYQIRAARAHQRLLDSLCNSASMTAQLTLSGQ